MSKEIKKIEKLPVGQRVIREKFSDDTFIVQDKIDEIIDVVNSFSSSTKNKDSCHSHSESKPKDDLVAIPPTENKQIPEWREGLENLALILPDPNQAIFNLPQLKGFIYNLLKSHSDSILKALEGEKRQAVLEGEIYDPMKADPACVAGFNEGLRVAKEIIIKTLN